ncbi:hypothetical protein [Paracoccus sp. R86501]|uniref:hypothetical protein n=1 Tax=Paracoccus sp. R86501 TaxID=3101711 RepID=UPI003671C50A
MRGWLILSVLAVAGCGEHRGWNPNYQFGDNAYGKYRTAREAALVAGSAPEMTIPVARPFYSPTPAKIAGQDPVPVPVTMGLPATKPAVKPALRRDPDAPIPIVSPDMMP